MDDQTEFLRQGFEEVKLDLVDTIGKANLHLRPETITRSLWTRARARLKALETILRRLIFLLAMTLQLAPARPRAARSGSVPPEGIEDATASFAAHLARPRRFVLMGRQLGPPREFALSRAAPGRPAFAAPLLAWVACLYAVLKDPDAAARRLARHIRRMKARGEAPPYCTVQPGLHRVNRQLGAIAGLLPALVRRALEGWADTG